MVGPAAALGAHLPPAPLENFLWGGAGGFSEFKQRFTGKGVTLPPVWVGVAVMGVHACGSGLRYPVRPLFSSLEVFAFCECWPGFIKGGWPLCEENRSHVGLSPAFIVFSCWLRGCLWLEKKH